MKFVQLGIVYFSCATAFARSSHLAARDLPPLLPKPIRLSLNEDGKYSVDVTMSPTSSAPQQFKFALTLSTGFTYVAGVDCATCNTASKFNAAQSNSVQSLNGNDTVSVLDETATGAVVKEDCSITTADGSGWAYPNQTVVVADSSTFDSSSGISGLIGLGTGAGNFSDTVFGGWLGRNPERPNFSYGMQLNKPSSTLDGGILHWLAPDTSAYKEPVTYKTMNPRVALSNGEQSTNSLNGDWSVKLDGFTFNSGLGTIFSQAVTDMNAILDPYFPDMYFPQAYTRLIYASLQEATVRKVSDTINTYTIPCDLQPSLSVTFGQYTITLTRDNLVKEQGDGTCIGTIQEWVDPAVEEFLFGSNFIANVYLIFVVSESGSTIGFASRADPPSNALSTGAIAGISVGCAVFAALVVGAAVFWFMKRKLKTQEQIQEESDQKVIRPFPSTPMDPPATSTPLLLPSASVPNTPQQSQFAEWRHLSYDTNVASPSGTYSGGDTTSDSTQIPVVDTPPPYIHSGHPLPTPFTDTRTLPVVSPRRRKEIEASGGALTFS